MAKKIRNLLNEIDKKFKESEEVSTAQIYHPYRYHSQLQSSLMAV